MLTPVGVTFRNDKNTKSIFTCEPLESYINRTPDQTLSKSDITFKTSITHRTNNINKFTAHDHNTTTERHEERAPSEAIQRGMPIADSSASLLSAVSKV